MFIAVLLCSKARRAGLAVLVRSARSEGILPLVVFLFVLAAVAGRVYHQTFVLWDFQRGVGEDWLQGRISEKHPKAEKTQGGNVMGRLVSERGPENVVFVLLSSVFENPRYPNKKLQLTVHGLKFLFSLNLTIQHHLYRT